MGFMHLDNDKKIKQLEIKIAIYDLAEHLLSEQPQDPWWKVSNLLYDKAIDELSRLKNTSTSNPYKKQSRYYYAFEHLKICSDCELRYHDDPRVRRVREFMRSMKDKGMKLT